PLEIRCRRDNPTGAAHSASAARSDWRRPGLPGSPQDDRSGQRAGRLRRSALTRAPRGALRPYSAPCQLVQQRPGLLQSHPLPIPASFEYPEETMVIGMMKRSREGTQETIMAELTLISPSQRPIQPLVEGAL